VHVKFSNDICTLNCLLSFMNDLDCTRCYFFCINITTSSFAKIPSYFIEPLFYAVILFFSYAIIHNVMNNDLLSQICSRY